jgi:hypothetical protein
MLALFSSLARRLRRFGVRALKHFPFGFNNNLIETVGENSGDRLEIIAWSSYEQFITTDYRLDFENLPKAQNAKTQLRNALYQICESVVSVHISKNRSARARNQAPTVLVRREKRQNTMELAA